MGWEPGRQCLQSGTNPHDSPIPFSPTGPGLGVGQSWGGCTAVAIIDRLISGAFSGAGKEQK